jgi:hypothetical protein
MRPACAATKARTAASDKPTSGASAHAISETRALPRPQCALPRHGPRRRTARVRQRRSATTCEGRGLSGRG